MGLTIPPKPSAPSDASDPEQMIKYQEEMFAYQFALQTQQSITSQEETTRTNMLKSEHDAMMAVIANMKV